MQPSQDDGAPSLRRGAASRVVPLFGAAWDHLLLLGLAVLLCQPWLISEERGFPQRDAAFSVVGLSHLQRVLLEGVPWRDGPLGWPVPGGVAQADWMTGQAALTLPLRLAGLAPTVIYEVACFLGILLTAWAVMILVRALTGPGLHAVLAGLAAGFNPVQMAHAHHGNLVHHEVMVLSAVLVGLALARDRVWLAAAAGAVWALSFHFGAYMGLHATLAVGITWAVAGQATRPRVRVHLALAGSAAMAALTMLPVAVFYQGYAAQHAVALPSVDMWRESWDLARTMAPLARAPLHDWLGAEVRPALDPSNPGYVVAGLAVVGLLSRRLRWPWVAVVMTTTAALALAIGPYVVVGERPVGLSGPLAVVYSLPGMDMLRGPARWLSVAFVGTAILAGAGLQWLAVRSGRAGLVVAASLFLLAVLELPRAESGLLAPRPSIYLELGDEPGPLYEHFPRGSRACRCSGATRLHAAADHGRALVGGNFARDTRASRWIKGCLDDWPGERATALLRATGVRQVLEHPPLGGRPRGWSCRRLDGHRICQWDGAVGPWPPPTGRAAGEGPVVGLGWFQVPSASVVEIRCEGREQVAPVETWLALAPAAGVEGYALWVALEAPCSGELEVSHGYPVFLRALEAR